MGTTRFLIASIAAALCIGRASLAAPIPFTFDPSGAVPPLTGGSVSADGISYDSYVHSVVQPGGNFVSERVAVVKGFSLNGHPMPAPDLNVSYGLYFDFIDTGVSAPPSPLTFTSNSFRLMADPGYLNGPPSSTFDGFGFANTTATGVADDILLATGSMVVGTSSFDPVTGVRRTHFVETFVPAPNEEGFFVGSPSDFPLFIEFSNTVPPGGLVVTPGPGGTLIQTINTAFGTAQFVPEPASAALLGAGILGLFALPLRRRRR